MAAVGTATVIVRTISGDEAKTTLAQAMGYRRIAWMVLRGDHERDPHKFIRDVRQVMFEQANEGA